MYLCANWKKALPFLSALRNLPNHTVGELPKVQTGAYNPVLLILSFL